MERTVFALFDDIFAVQRAAVALERNGFAREGMSTLAPDPRGRHTRNGPNGAEGVFSPVSIPVSSTALAPSFRIISTALSTRFPGDDTAKRACPRRRLSR